MKSFMVVPSFRSGTNMNEATLTVATLPMSAWWDLDVFPLNAPAPLMGQ